MADLLYPVHRLQVDFSTKSPGKRYSQLGKIILQLRGCWSEDFLEALVVIDKYFHQLILHNHLVNREVVYQFVRQNTAADLRNFLNGSTKAHPFRIASTRRFLITLLNNIVV